MAFSRVSPRNDITQADVLKQLRYEPETGLLYRRPIPERNRIDRMRNSRFANKPATYLNSTGHVQLLINGHHYLAHRVIWLLVHGEWPEGDIDHINGDRADNRLSNLRIATPAQNSTNTRRYKNNTTGYRGVHWNKRQRRWTVRIGVGNDKVHVGCFGCPTIAAFAYDSAARKYHGGFATLNFPIP